MATCDLSIETWTVVIEDKHKGEKKAYICPISDTVGDIVRQYSKDVGVKSEEVVLLSTTGRPLSSQETLREVGEAAPGMGVVKLFPEAAITIKIETYGEDERRALSVRPSFRPDDLHPLIRRLFAMDGERMFRLRTPLSLLCLWYNMTLSEQQVGAGSLLQVDPAYDVQVTEAWSGETRHHFMYASESCEEMAGEALLAFLKCGDQEVRPDRLLMDALLALDGVRRPGLALDLHCPRELVLLDDSRLRARLVWPADRLERAARGLPSLSFEGEPVPRPAALCSQDLPEHGLLASRPLRLEVRLSSGQRLAVRLPRCATVSDLRAAVRAEEQTEAFELRRGREAVAGDAVEELSAAGVADGAELSVGPRLDAFEVRLRDRWTRWRSDAGPQRFSELMARVAARTHVDYEALLGLSLHCAGCGRRVSAEEEEFQLVPAACCRLRSLVLEEPPAPPAVADAGTQAQTGLGPRPRSRKSISVRPSTEDRGVQAYARWHQVGVQTERTTAREISIQVSSTWNSCRSSNQTEVKMVPSSTATENMRKSSSTQSKTTKTVASTQSPPPTPTPPAKFCIRTWGDLSHLPPFTLRLPTTCGTVTVAQLRRAVEAEVRSKVLMRQRRATTPRGKEVFGITGYGNFVDSTGGKWKFSEVKELRDVELSDTDPPLPAPAGVQLWIGVFSAK